MNSNVVGGVYVSRKGYQPVCVGTDEKGELVWEYRMKEPWHQKLFPVPYTGDFMAAWMGKAYAEKHGPLDRANANG